MVTTHDNNLVHTFSVWLASRKPAIHYNQRFIAGAGHKPVVSQRHFRSKLSYLTKASYNATLFKVSYNSTCLVASWFFQTKSPLLECLRVLSSSVQEVMTSYDSLFKKHLSTAQSSLCMPAGRRPQTTHCSFSDLLTQVQEMEAVPLSSSTLLELWCWYISLTPGTANKTPMQRLINPVSLVA